MKNSYAHYYKLHKVENDKRRKNNISLMYLVNEINRFT